ncbi:hypothetical protein HY945_05660 [Candidatus Gottesmanbacteria bacterium]|nr:hypothetical protein [Candidatus Gottesmanbacteria bacterium]
MQKHFYHKVVVIDSIHVGLEDLNLQPHEKQELISIVESSIHHTVLDTVLADLSENDKKTFLALVTQPDQKHDLIWSFLEMKVDKAEKKIVEAVDKLIAVLHEDIKETKNKPKS